MAAGRVYLVGAGPGDPGLLTLKGKRCLESADAVVYDRLLSPRVLGFAKRGAEFHFVGKSADHHSMTQDQINQLLADLALQGKVVVRLKGGDPFVFGRGSEEAAFLHARQVPWEVVPGITSALAVPAFAGIPVTHRAVSPSFTVVTGHRCRGEEANLDWASLAAVDGTLVILMGVSQLANIAAQLTAHGKAPDTPAALVRWGTRAFQQTLTGTLSDIVEKAKVARFTAPACIIIGAVVTARDTLQWSELRPLFGKRVFVAAETRGAAEKLCADLEHLGAETVAFIAEDVLELDGAQLGRAVSDSLEHPASWLFQTTLGVHQFFRYWHACDLDVRQFAGLQFGALNVQAANALRDRGVAPDFVATDCTSIHRTARSALDTWLHKVTWSGSVYAERVAWRHEDWVQTVLNGHTAVQSLDWHLREDVERFSALFGEWLAEGCDDVQAETAFAELTARRLGLIVQSPGHQRDRVVGVR